MSPSTKHSAQEIMSSKLITIHFEASVAEAHELMTARKIRHLPVVDDDGAVVGLLSDRDVQRAMSPKKSTQDFDFDPSFQVKSFMSWPVRAVEEHEPVADVARRMLAEKVSAFLVFSAHQAPVGIVTTDDLLRLLISLLHKDPSGLRLSLNSIMDEYGMRSALGYQ